MKVIDLLNKIANGEQPKKIKYRNNIYIFEECNGDMGYVNRNFITRWFASEIECDLTECLNEEIEIIEDTPKGNKKIEKLELKKECFKNPSDLSDIGKIRYYYDNKELGNKINEIIDKINGEENE